MQKSDMPYDKLVFLQEQLGLGSVQLESLDPYRALFIARKYEFAGFLYDRFLQISMTRMILEREERRGLMKDVWAHWFESLFKTPWDESFFRYLWRSGLRHIEVNLDQSYLNLGYCIVRQFCHQIACSEVPVTERVSVCLAISKMLDLCLLVETNAYMAAASYCDREVMKGISHQIRNPITIIGGNALRIQKRSAPNTDLFQACENIILESMRLERLVKDIAAYLDMFQREAKPTTIHLDDLISATLEKLAAAKPNDAKISVVLDPSFPDVRGDVKDLEAMFFYLLENSMEALTSPNPYIEIKSHVKSFSSFFIEVEIFNSGQPPKAEDLEDLAAPFYSSKPAGTGLGLPIARLAVKRNLATLILVPFPGQGTKTIIQLPLPDMYEYKGSERDSV
jgi:signal transduction histidine kinase